VLRLSLSAQDQIELHKKAAGWYQAQGLEEQARHHAHLAAGPARPAAGSGRSQIEPLSGREIEVLRLIAAGLSNQEIAGRLIIAPGTVKRHINNIYGKLGVQSRTQAVARGREIGLL
jgi:ATP/maltotriose-dependent transcriptional regulator MalT